MWSLTFVIFGGVYPVILVPFILLFYFVSQKYLNELSRSFKPITVCYLHAVTVCVFLPLLSVSIIQFDFNFCPEGGKATCPARCPDSSAVSVPVQRQSGTAH